MLVFRDVIKLNLTPVGAILRKCNCSLRKCIFILFPARYSFALLNCDLKHIHSFVHSFIRVAGSLLRGEGWDDWTGEDERVGD